MNEEEYPIEEELEEVMCENKLLQEEIKDLCKRIKVNEKSRRKMQQSLMTKIQQRDNIIKEIKDLIKRSEYEIDFSENGFGINDYYVNNISKILNIDKGDD